MNKDKFKKLKLTEAVQSLLLDVYTSTYHWEGLPDGVRPEYIELYLACFGECFIGNAWGRDLAARCERAGKPDVYGLGMTPIITTYDGRAITTDPTEDDTIIIKGKPSGVICYANNTKEPQPLIQIITEGLTEAITSLLANITQSRMAPIYAVADDVIKRAVESAKADIIAGKPTVIIANNILTEVEGIKSLEVVNFTDVDKQDKIQYISKVIDDYLRWFLSCYGQAVQGNGKMAQQTVDEVNGTTSASFILTELGYRWRKKAADKLNEVLGWSVEVTYNKPWAVEAEKYTEEVEDTEALEDELNPGEDPENSEGEENGNPEEEPENSEDEENGNPEEEPDNSEDDKEQDEEKEDKEK